VPRFDAAFFRVADLLAVFTPLFRRAAVVAFDALFAVARRPVARFDAVVDLRRVFLPDDFDAVDMIDSSRKVHPRVAQDSRAVTSAM